MQAAGNHSAFFITLFWAYGMTQAMPADNAGSGNHSVFITRFWAYGMTQAMPADNTGGPESFFF